MGVCDSLFTGMDDCGCEPKSMDPGANGAIDSSLGHRPRIAERKDLRAEGPPHSSVPDILFIEFDPVFC